jgi:hypothetical protein
MGSFELKQLNFKNIFTYHGVAITALAPIHCSPFNASDDRLTLTFKEREFSSFKISQRPIGQLSQQSITGHRK